MERDSDIRAGITRTVSSILLIVACLAALVAAGDPPSISIIPLNNGMAFGAINLLDAHDNSIEYYETGAAQFMIRGRAKKKIRITLSAESLYLDGQSIPLVLSNARCAFSTDAGENWTTFSTGPLFHDMRFPKIQGEKESSIYLRIGGSIPSTGRVQRGTYTGDVSIQISKYPDDDDDHDD